MSSCFKIITCGSDSADKDELLQPTTESKRSTDKRGWSFRKKSASHQVLSNTVITESPSTGNREIPLQTTTNSNAQTNFTIADKLSVPEWKTEYPLSSVAYSNAPDSIFSTKNESKTSPLIPTKSTVEIDPFVSKDNIIDKTDHDLKGSSAIVIQTAIRGYLARRSLLKLKNVVKLQAAVRGHLVRSKAVGTLRCVQAIIKMQALVRARRARLSLQGLSTEKKHDERDRDHSLKPLGKEVTGTKVDINYSSTIKLLSNAFAHQLMQSTSKSKQINIKCDPLKHDSSWNWLERWMSVYPLDSVEPEKPQFSHEKEENEGRTQNTGSELRPGISIEDSSFSTNLSSYCIRAETSIDNEESLISYHADNFDLEDGCPTSSIADDMQKPYTDDLYSSNSQESSSKIGISQSGMLPVAPSQTLTTSDQVEHTEQPKRSMKRGASEQPESECKKPLFGSRKATNPAFVAVQSKFEGLSSTATSHRSISSSSRDVGVESKGNRVSSPSDSQTKTKETTPTENSTSNEIRAHVASSDSGSLLSITSTLDSPDGSDAGVIEIEKEPEETTADRNVTTDYVASTEAPDIQQKTKISVSQPNLSSLPCNHPGSDEETVDLSSSIDPQKVERLPERSSSDVQLQLHQVGDQESYRSSPEGSPRSHVTFPESHGTPSSQVSINAKRSKFGKNRTAQSKKYQITSKRSPSNQNHELGTTSSIEQLPKDPKSGKKRSSFGSSKSNHLDQDPRDSNSSSSLPSYMQATKSARAKALMNMSPSSSPDVQDKEVYIKKRHSLPGSNGKQGSPRMQRSMSQVQPGAKGSSTNSPHEKKWIR